MLADKAGTGGGDTLGSGVGVAAGSGGGDGVRSSLTYGTGDCRETRVVSLFGMLRVCLDACSRRCFEVEDDELVPEKVGVGSGEGREVWTLESVGILGSRRGLGIFLKLGRILCFFD